MVQFLSFDEERHVITDNNSYWKLGLSEYQNARKTIKYLEEHGYRCRENASKAVTLDAVGRYQRGLMSYEGLSVSELQSLCKAKGVSSKAKTASRLARALEKADDNATFRFLDLPAGIRNVIYELYFLDLPDLTSSHIQPPLTLASSVLRIEALPLFYGSSTFVFTIFSNTDVDNCGYNTTGFSWGADKMMQMPAGQSLTSQELQSDVAGSRGFLGSIQVVRVPGSPPDASQYRGQSGQRYRLGSPTEGRSPQ